VTTKKTRVRNEWLHKRCASTVKRQDLILAKALTELLPLLNKNQWLCLYWPLQGEIDLRGLAQQSNIHMALPVVKKHQLHMYDWYPGYPLYPDDCGFPAPLDQYRLHPSQVGILLAPCLAFDKRGIRLGYGGGYYDRLRSKPDWRGITSIIVASITCQVNQLPAEPWDIPFDGWFTEMGLTML